MPDIKPYPSRAAAEAAWWQAWRTCDFSWQGLARIPAGDGTLQDYWRMEAGRLIAEPGSDRLWTRFHCPLVFADGSPTPKMAWSTSEWEDLRVAVRTRLARGGEAAPCRLDGAVLDRLNEAEDQLPERDGYLWLIARHAFFAGDVDLSRTGFELLDVHGAWFGGAFHTEGAHIVHYDVYRSVQAQGLPEHAQMPVADSIIAAATEQLPVNKRNRWPVVVGLTLAFITVLITVLVMRP